MIIRFLQKLATPKDSRAASDSMGGPIAIFVMFWYSVQGSILVALSFTCFINVNLAIFNLLPLPILDGGHLMFFMIEAVIRRPVTGKVREVAVQFGPLFIAFLFALVIYNDSSRIVTKGCSLAPW